MISFEWQPPMMTCLPLLVNADVISFELAHQSLARRTEPQSRSHQWLVTPEAAQCVAT
jgi:hypothetical protein